MKSNQNLQIDEFDTGDDSVEINEDKYGNIHIDERVSVSDLVATDVFPRRTLRNLLKTDQEISESFRGRLPSEDDLNKARHKIHLLNEKELLGKAIASKTFCDQIRWVENQLRVIRAEISDPKMLVPDESLPIKKLISKQWAQLGRTLGSAESYCVNK